MYHLTHWGDLESKLSADMLFKRRRYCQRRCCQVNGTTLLKHFQQYVEVYIGSKSETKRIYEESNEREYAVCMAPKKSYSGVICKRYLYIKKGRLSFESDPRSQERISSKKRLMLNQVLSRNRLCCLYGVTLKILHLIVRPRTI